MFLATKSLMVSAGLVSSAPGSGGLRVQQVVAVGIGVAANPARTVAPFANLEVPQCRAVVLVHTHWHGHQFQVGFEPGRGGAELRDHVDHRPAVFDGGADVGIELGDGIDQDQGQGHRDQHFDERERRVPPIAPCGTGLRRRQDVNDMQPLLARFAAVSPVPWGPVPRGNADEHFPRPTIDKVTRQPDARGTRATAARHYCTPRPVRCQAESRREFIDHRFHPTRFIRFWERSSLAHPTAG